MLGAVACQRAYFRCGFTIAHQSGDSSETHFGGEVLLRPEGRKPLSFSLKFGTADDSKYCLAAYYDPNGYRLNIQSLAKSILTADQAALIPASFEVSLNSALLAYSQRGQGPTSEPGVLLFAVDLGASISCPICRWSAALYRRMMVELQSLRVMVASTPLSRSSVEKFNKLIPDGMSPLSDGSQGGDEAQGERPTQAALTKGLNLSAVLLFGKEPRTLALPVAGDVAGPKGNLEAATPPVQPNGQPGSSPPASQPALTESVKWFEIEKSLGPLSVRRIGFSYDAPRVGIKFDASLQLSVLTFNLEGLGLRYALGGSTEPWRS